MKVPLTIPDVPGVPREVVERVVRSRRTYCQKCRQFASSERQIFNAARNVVTKEVTCGCGTVLRNIPIPRPPSSVT